jgi:hypothetical protein
MLDHLRNHQNGGPMTGDPDVDGMMHQMMDGIVRHMPADRDGIVLPGNDERHQTPGPKMSPEP